MRKNIWFWYESCIRYRNICYEEESQTQPKNATSFIDALWAGFQVCFLTVACFYEMFAKVLPVISSIVFRVFLRFSRGILPVFLLRISLSSFQRSLMSEFRCFFFGISGSCSWDLFQSCSLDSAWVFRGVSAEGISSRGFTDMVLELFVEFLLKIPSKCIIITSFPSMYSKLLQEFP